MSCVIAQPSFLSVSYRLSLPPRSTRRRANTPRCAVRKVLVVDLQELLGTPPVDELGHFSKRVEVERESTGEETCMVFSLRSGNKPSMQSIKDADLAEPDALAVLDGSELYQRRSRTFDPYRANTVWKDWQPTSIKWIATTFFGENTDRVEKNEEYELIFRCLDDAMRSEVCDDIAKKLKQIDITTRATEAADSSNIIVAPPAAGAAKGITFRQRVLSIEELVHLFSEAKSSSVAACGGRKISIYAGRLLKASAKLLASGFMFQRHPGQKLL